MSIGLPAANQPWMFWLKRMLESLFTVPLPDFPLDTKGLFICYLKNNPETWPKTLHRECLPCLLFSVVRCPWRTTAVLPLTRISASHLLPGGSSGGTKTCYIKSYGELLRGWPQWSSKCYVLHCATHYMGPESPARNQGRVMIERLTFLNPVVQGMDGGSVCFLWL